MTNDVFTAHERTKNAIAKLQLLIDTPVFTLNTIELIKIERDLEKVEFYLEGIIAEKLTMQSIKDMKDDASECSHTKDKEA